MRSGGIVLTVLVVTAACGGDSGEPLVAGELEGDYDGNAFTPDVGFATIYEDASIIGLGDGDLDCDSPTQPEPPSGTSALLVLPSFDVGLYSNVFVDLYRNVDDFEGFGSNSGTVELTLSTDETVAGSVSYDYTADDGRAFSLAGTFEVIRCE